MNESGPEPRPEAALACAVKLEIFEGPLDLLLHLIRINEVDVVDIPISEIAQQYVAYLGLMQELNLEVAGDYLLMAATLAWIKSRMILPVESEGEEEEGADPRAELVARLLEYQRFKEASETLGERTRLERDVFAARGAEPQATPEGEREIEVDLVHLLEAFRRVLRGVRKDGPGLHEVEAETVTVRERMLVVMALLARVDAVEFERIFELGDGRAPSRAILVTTFLAILELVRVSALRVYQGVDACGVPDGPIRLRRSERESESWRERIADIM